MSVAVLYGVVDKNGNELFPINWRPCWADLGYKFKIIANIKPSVRIWEKEVFPVKITYFPTFEGNIGGMTQRKYEAACGNWINFLAKIDSRITYQGGSTLPKVVYTVTEDDIWPVCLFSLSLLRAIRENAALIKMYDRLIFSIDEFGLLDPWNRLQMVTAMPMYPEYQPDDPYSSISGGMTFQVNGAAHKCYRNAEVGYTSSGRDWDNKYVKYGEENRLYLSKNPNTWPSYASFIERLKNNFDADIFNPIWKEYSGGELDWSTPYEDIKITSNYMENPEELAKIYNIIKTYKGIHV